MEIGKKYGLRDYRCDFYLPKYNTYIEITSFLKDSTGYAKKIWPAYHKKIMIKEESVKNVLKSKFRFVQVVMNTATILLVRRNMA